MVDIPPNKAAFHQTILNRKDNNFRQIKFKSINNKDTIKRSSIKPNLQANDVNFNSGY